MNRNVGLLYRMRQCNAQLCTIYTARYLAAQCIVIGPVCVFVAGGRAGGRAVSEPYYSQRARSVCVSLSAFSLLMFSFKHFCDVSIHRVHIVHFLFVNFLSIYVMRFTMLQQNQLTSGSSTIGVNAPIDKGYAYVNGEMQAGLIYDSSFMSQIAATAIVKVRARDLQIVPYHVQGRGTDRLKTATAECHIS